MPPPSHGADAGLATRWPWDPGLRIRQILELPPLPRVASRILTEINNDDVAIPQLASTIEMDPGLTARILGVANSAYFGCAERIHSLSDAIIRVLGLNMVRSLALSIVLSEPFDVSRCTGFRLDRYWFTAMLSANLAHNLAGAVWPRDPGLPRLHVYTSALLHNLGMLALVHAFPEEMQAVFAGCENDVDALCSDDISVRGLSYMQAGALLARRWHLPPAVAAVMRWHRDLDYRGDHWQTAILIGFCARTACSLFDEDGEVDSGDPRLALLRVEPSRVERVLERFEDRRDDLRRMAAMLAQR